jgi:septal ring factor EnvC (AmiA/AmiB activator)
LVFVRGGKIWSCWESCMSDNDENATAVPVTETGKELLHLRTRIDQQSRQLNRHARELTALHNDLAELDQRIDAHQHRDA